MRNFQPLGDRPTLISNTANFTIVCEKRATEPKWSSGDWKCEKFAPSLRDGDSPFKSRGMGIPYG